MKNKIVVDIIKEAREICKETKLPRTSYNILEVSKMLFELQFQAEDQEENEIVYFRKGE